MYPVNPDMDFDCPCPVRERKNIWNNITGTHVRYCPVCTANAVQYYKPTERWDETGRGLAGEPMPDYLRAQMDAAAVALLGLPPSF